METLATARPVSISADEERALVISAQMGDSTAAERLVRAYLPAIRKAARAASVSRRLLPVDPEDAFQEALTEFLGAVEEHDLSLGVRLAAYVPALMAHAVLRAQHATTQVAVPRRTATKFYGLLRAHGGNLDAAMADAATQEMRPETFLAVYAALAPAESLSVANSDEEGLPNSAGATWDAIQIAEPNDPLDDLVEAAYLDWLFSQVDAREAATLRLYYGFTDPATEALRLEKGYRGGELLTDDQVGHVLAMGRMTAHRCRVKALAKMREAAEVALQAEGA